MQKVYLLLRNNQQTGPYSFEDLLTLHLKPKDLVWVEGKSHGWRYPNEIEALKPYVPESEIPEQGESSKNVIEEHPRQIPHSRPTAAIPQKIFVSMPKTGEIKSVTREPVDSMEQRAEELRKRAQEYAPPQEPVQTNFKRGLYNAEEEYTQWVYQTKTKKKKIINKKSAGIVAVSIMILSAGWWASTKMVNNYSVSAHEIIKPSQEPEQPITSNEIDSKTQEANAPIEEQLLPALPTTAKEVRKKQEQEKKTAAPEKKLVSEDKKLVPAPTENPVESTQKNNDYTIPVEEEKESVASKPVEKKKTIKEKISELFKNKKTEQPAGSAEQNPNDSRPGERTASRRNEEKEATVTDVSEQVEIKTNKIADSWMMGVKNLKLTLINKSNLVVSAAKVEVLYYSDQNILLDKKILSFSNISPGKSQTVAAPDQRLADHIEHKVVSASGIENAYVRH